MSRIIPNAPIMASDIGAALQELDSRMPDIKELENDIQALKEEIAEAILLGNTEKETKNVYSMTYEEYMELPGNVRL